MNNERIERIRAALQTALDPVSLEIIDESHKHAGHASARGGGHYIVRIVSPQFAGQNTLQRHRLVYQVMDEMMKNNEVHALGIQAHTPDEI